MDISQNLTGGVVSEGSADIILRDLIKVNSRPDGEDASYILSLGPFAGSRRRCRLLLPVRNWERLPSEFG